LQVVILERDPAPPHGFDGATHPDGDAYLNHARARNGSPQFAHLHGFLKGGWCAPQYMARTCKLKK
jgi:hypothetical protein